MTDLIKRDDALAAIDTFKRDFEQSWKVQFSADIAALPAINLADRIEELEKQCSAYARADQLFVEDINELEAKLAKALDALRNILSGDDLYPWRIAREVLVELNADIYKDNLTNRT